MGGSLQTSRLVIKEHVIGEAARTAAPFYGQEVYAYWTSVIPSSVTLNVGQSKTFIVNVLWTDNSAHPQSELAERYVTGGIGSISGYFTFTAQTPGGGSYLGYTNGHLIGPENWSQLSFQAQITVTCALPTNFRQTSVSGANGTLTFVYEWDSTIGTVSNLAACRVGENVAYSSGSSDPHIPPSPPFPSSLAFPNPTVSGVTPDLDLIPATIGGLEDTHSTPGTFVTPFPIGTTAFTAQQIYFYKCTCFNANLPVKLFPAGGATISITRSVAASSTNVGTFTITKSAASSSKAVP